MLHFYLSNKLQAPSAKLQAASGKRLKKDTIIK